jgi:hypothetical protein
MVWWLTQSVSLGHDGARYTVHICGGAPCTLQTATSGRMYQTVNPPRLWMSWAGAALAKITFTYMGCGNDSPENGPLVVWHHGSASGLMGAAGPLRGAGRYGARGRVVMCM